MVMSVDAHCETCEKDWFVLISSDEASSLVRPIGCLTCKAVTTADFTDTPLRCLDCGSEQVIVYGNRDDWNGKGNVILHWDTASITDGRHRCPNCGELSLRFGVD